MNLDYRPLTLTSCRRTRRAERRRATRRWVVWAVVVVFTPVLAMAAYTPAFMQGSNNLSEVANPGTARTNLGLGTAATKAASSGGAATVASLTGSFTAGHAACVADTAGTISDCGANPAIAPTVSKFTGALPVTLSATANVTTISAMATPAAGTYNLPTPAAGWRGCLKDGTTNFSTNAATVKGPSGNIYADAGAVAATTGVVASQRGSELCFLSDGTDYYVE